MNVTELLRTLSDKKVRLSIKDGQLSYEAPKGVMTGALLEQIKRNKPELLSRLQQHTEIRDAGETLQIFPAPRDEGGMPLSYSQRRLWLLDQYAAGDSAYHMPAALRLEGPLDVEALRRTIDSLVSRHESLRTVFVLAEGEAQEPVQKILPPEPLAIEIEPVSEEQVLERAQQHARGPFSLSEGPLFKVGLLRVSEEAHVLLVNMHHIISDGWSLSVMTREFLALYAAYSQGHPDPLQPLPLQYADYAHWQRQQPLEPLLDYWRQRLQDYEDNLALPYDRPRPAERQWRAASLRRHYPAALSQKLARFSQQRQSTLFMTLLSALVLVLQRYTGRDDLCIGTTTAGRDAPHLDQLIGFFINILPLRIDLSGDPSGEELLARVKAVALGAYEHRALPFEDMLGLLPRHRDSGTVPLVPVVMRHQNFPQAKAEGMSGGVAVSGLSTAQSRAKNELDLQFFGDGDALYAEVEYAAELFDRDTVERLLEHHQQALETLLSAPQTRLSDYHILGESERDRLLHQWNRTEHPWSDQRGVAQRLEHWAQAQPDAVACRCPEQALSYGELNRRANRLAHCLRARGIGPESRVGLCLERNSDFLCALLGILKAGGAYVPLDPGYPAHYLQQILADARPQSLLTRSGLSEGLDSESDLIQLDQLPLDQYSDADPAPCTGPDHLAYIMYTSGSTGRPKGVQVTQAQILNWLNNLDATLPFEAGEVVAQKTTQAFAVSVKELLAGLLNGVPQQLIPDDTARDPQAFIETLEQSGASRLNIVPSQLQSLLARIEPDSDRLPALKYCTTAGEPLTRALLDELRQKLPRVQLWNNYGCTELNDISYHSPGGAGGEEGKKGEGKEERKEGAATENGQIFVPIGRPIHNTRVYLLDGDLQPVPQGVVGEIHVDSAGLSRGYWGRPGQTAEQYLPNPFSDVPGARLYKTGDLARHLKDGQLEYLSRRDFQIKIRGNRIDVRQVEKVLNEHGQIQQGLVGDHTGEGRDTRLVAYYVAAEGQDPGAEALRSYLSARLPGYMVPSLYMPLPVIPRLPNGKLDRRSLPEPEVPADESLEAPQSATEKTLAAIWAQVLEMEEERIGRESNFFAIGGHSLLATGVVARIRERLSVELGLRVMFEQDSLRKLAASIDRLSAESPHSPLPLEAADRSRPLPLSFAQQRLWFINQFEQGQDTAYNIPIALRLEGRLNVDALRYAINRMIERHESLRTHFEMADGEAVQVVAPQLKLEIPVVEIEHEQVKACAEELAGHSFDLSTGPLILVRLYQIDDHSHLLLLNMHHIISDRWSEGIMVREFAALYRAHLQGEADPLPEPAIQYPDFAYWQRQWLSGETLERQAAYWKEALRDAPALLELPYDRPRPPAQTYNGAYAFFRIDKSLLQKLERLGQKESATLYMLLLAAFKVLLFRYSSRGDIAVGATIANRTRPELESLIGFFANTLVMRSRLEPRASFDAFLQRVKGVCLGAYDNQDIPFEYLLEQLQVPRQVSHSPLFQVMFNLHNAPQSDISLPDLEIAPPGEAGSQHRTAKFDLTLDLFASGGGLRGRLEYNTDLFERSTIQRLIGHYHNLLEAIVADPQHSIGTLPLLSSDEHRQLVHEWNNTRVEDNTTDCVHYQFEARAASSPEAPALRFEERVLTYAELNRRANQLAHYLIERDAGPETPVALCLERSPELLVAILAVLKAGGCYLPLDPEHPQTRLAEILRDSGANLVLTQESLSRVLRSTEQRAVIELDSDPQWLSEYPTDNPDAVVIPSNLAYILYTSGSTGRPKGVMSSHAGLLNRLNWMQKQYRLQPSERILQKTPYTFDVSVWEFLWPLCQGAQLVLALPGDHKDPVRLAQLLEREQISTVHFVPSMLSAFLAQNPPVPGALKRVICSGEALPGALLENFNRWSGGAVEIHNLYGPTEASIDVSHCAALHSRPEHFRSPPIGRPVDNTQLYILDAELEPVPVGVAGQLYIGGVQLARGYLNRAGQSAEQFIPHPFSDTPGARLYQTGDRARYLADGNIEYLGRLDRQLKLRGLRIEPGEIEQALLGLEGIKEAAVDLHRAEDGGEEKLVAYLASDSGELPATQTLRESLQAQLPDYMVPSHYIHLETLPLTANGKLDRRSLPAPDTESLAREEYVAPATESEKLLAEIWSEVLQLPVERIGVEDNFFGLGGHSLLAMKVIARVRTRVLAVLPLKAMFEQPVLRDLATYLDKLPEVAKGEKLPSRLEHRDGVGYAVSAAQKRLWLLHEMDRASVAYQSYDIVELPSGLEVETVEKVFTRLVERHEMLRTFFGRAEKEVLQYVQPPYAVTIGTDDVGSRQQLRQSLAAMVESPFDLTKGPLFRVRVVRFPRGEQLLLVCFHEIIADGYSHRIIREEVKQLLANRALQPLEIQYKDFAAWQNNLLKSGQNESREYWREHLRGEIKRLDLPFDYAGDPEGRAPARSYEVVASPQLHEKLNQVARDRNLTLFAVLQATLSLFLARLTGQKDVVMAVPVAGREHPYAEKIVGFFLNTLLIRHRVALEESFDSLLRQVDGTIRRGLGHQDYPFEELLNDLTFTRKFNRFPVTPVIMNMLNFLDRVPLKNLSDRLASGKQLEDGSENGTCQDSGHQAKTELELYITEYSNSISIRGDYRADLFKPETIEYLLTEFMDLLEQVSSEPERTISGYQIFNRPRLIGERQYPQALVSPYLDFVRPLGGELPFGNLIDAVRAQVERAPRAVAVHAGSRNLSYADLWNRSGAIANALAAQDIADGKVLAILADDPVFRIEAMLGGFRHGGVVMPLDPREPLPRLRKMIEEVEPAAWLIQGQGLECSQVLSASTDAKIFLMDEEESASDAGNVIHVDDTDLTFCPERDSVGSGVGYIFFTSGSTGTPKAVHGTARALAHFIHWEISEFNLDSTCRVSQLTAPAFDPVLRDVFAALCAGGTVCVPPRPTSEMPPANLLEWLEHSRVTLVHSTPTVLRRLMEESLESGRLPYLQRILLAGEALTAADARQWMSVFGQRIALVNLYGSTEATLIRCFHRVTESDVLSDNIPVGRPLPDTSAIVLDDSGDICPRQEIGELYLRSPYTSLGYYNRPDITGEVFLENPFVDSHGDRIYKTGDLAEFLPDGSLRLAGRRDNQIKVRGVRVDSAEVENALLGHDDIRAAAAVGVKVNGGATVLVAFVVCTPGATIDMDSLREYMLRQLPAAFVPAAIHVLESLPLTSTAKVDRRVLAEMHTGFAKIDSNNHTPNTEREKIFMEIWSRLLGVSRDKIGIFDEFYALGGDSLLALRAIDALRRHDLYLTPGQFLRYQTIAKLAAIAADAPNAADQGVVTGELPFGTSLRWFFSLENPPVRWSLRRVFELQKSPDPTHLKAAFKQVLAHHDGLRARFIQQADGSWRGHIAAPDSEVPFECLDIECSDLKDAKKQIAAIVNQWGGSLDFSKGPLCGLKLFRLGEQGPAYLYLLVHHTLVDGDTIDLLLADLMLAYRQLAQNRTPELPAKSSSIIQINQTICDYTREMNPSVEEAYWDAFPWAEMSGLPVDYPHGMERNTSSSAQHIEGSLTRAQTSKLQENLAKCNGGISVQNAIFSALTKAVSEWGGGPWMEVLSIEAKGDILLNETSLDIVRTVGWISMSRNLVLKDPDTTDALDRLRKIDTQINAIPNSGFGPTFLEHGSDDPEIQEIGRRLNGRFKHQIEVNFRGSFETPEEVDGQIKAVDDIEDRFEDGENDRRFLLLLSACIINGRLQMTFQYSRNIHKEKTVKWLLGRCFEDLREMAMANEEREPRAVAEEPEEAQRVEIEVEEN